MAFNSGDLVVGVFPKGANVQGALDALRDAGFGRDQIGVALREGGVVTSTLVADLAKLGVPQDRAAYYNSEYENGNTIVSVRADGREQEAYDILTRNGASDEGARGGYAQDTGYNTAQGNYAQGAGYNTTQGNYAQGTAYDTAQTGTYDTGDTERQSVRLREEQLQAEKQRVQAGEVRLHKDVVEEQRSINVPVSHEEVFVERRPVAEGQVSDTPVGQEEVIRVPVSEEQVNVTKTPVVTGEVGLGKRVVTENQQVSDTVRREEPRLETDGNPNVRTDEDLTNR